MYPVEGFPHKGNFVKDINDTLTKNHGVNFDLAYFDGDQISAYGRFKMALNLASMCRKKKYDIIHIHYGLALLTTLFIPLKASVVSFYGCDINVRWLRTIARVMSIRVHSKIFVSESMRDRLKTSNSYVIQSGVDSERYRPMDMLECKEVLGLDAEKKYILFTSNPERSEKNYVLYKEIIQYMQEKDPKVTEFIMGGRVTSKDLPFLYGAAHAMFITSTREGSPISTKEALCSNLPIFSTDVGDVKSQIEGVSGNFIIPKIGIEAAEIVLGYFKNYERSDGRKRGESYSLNEMGAKIYEVYRKVVEDQHP
jgi:glycosyltransferase involved in cell wall biosynthesis